MKSPWWLWPNILSLDAPVIAVVWQEAFARSLNASITPTERALLFLAVWCVYAADHVADGFRLGAPPGSAPRHRFAFRHRRALIFAIFLAATVAAALLPGVDFRVLATGCGVAAVVAVYFVWNHFAGHRLARRWAKECVVGFVFAGGCALVPLVASPSVSGAGAAAIFGLVCSANCLLIARLDRERDMHRGETSLAVRLAPRTRPARFLAAMAVTLSLFLLPRWLPLAVSLVVSALGLWAGVWVEKWAGPAVAAVWADAVLLAPVPLFAAAAWLPL